MRIRTIDGQPLPAEIAEHTARAIALAELLHPNRIPDYPIEIGQSRTDPIHNR